MRKEITFLLIYCFSFFAFGQNKEYRKAVNLFNDKKYSETLVIVDKLLNKEYGELSEEQEFYSLQMRLNTYNSLKNYKKAYDAAEPYLAFVKKSTNLFSDENKLIAIREAEQGIALFKSKMLSEQGLSSSSTANSSTEKNTNTKETADNKTVTLIVSGIGKTIEEAKLNALRSAIEQAFGTFISSKTEILNDALVKDEIVSVSNGNIQKYDVVSQLEIPNNGFAVTLNATVSINKLASFIESKGGTTEFNGSLLSYNLKVKEAYKKSELVALNNLIPTFKHYLNNCIDYNISIISENPKMADNDVVLRLKLVAQFNNNIDEFVKIFTKTLRDLSLEMTNVYDYDKLNIPLYSIYISPIYFAEINNKGKEKKKRVDGLFVFRNEETQKQIVKLLDFITLAFNFEIDNGIKKTNGFSIFNSIKKVLRFDRQGDFSYPYTPLYFHDGIKLNTRVLTPEGNYSKEYPYFEFEDKMYFFNNEFQKDRNGLIMGYGYFGVGSNLQNAVDREDTCVGKDWKISIYNNTYAKYYIFEGNKSINPILIDFENLKSNNKVFTLIIDDYFSKDKLDFIKDYKINKNE